MTQPKASEENPFERYGLDPNEGIAGITERMREHIADAGSEEEKSKVRDAWIELTRDPRRRLALSLGAHPETRRPLGAAPSALAEESSSLEVRDLLPFVSLADCFEGESSDDTSADWDDDLIFRGESPSLKRFRGTKEKE